MTRVGFDLLAVTLAKLVEVGPPYAIVNSFDLITRRFLFYTATGCGVVCRYDTARCRI